MWRRSGDGLGRDLSLGFLETDRDLALCGHGLTGTTKLRSRLRFIEARDMVICLRFWMICLLVGDFDFFLFAWNQCFSTLLKRLESGECSTMIFFFWSEKLIFFTEVLKSKFLATHG